MIEWCVRNRAMVVVLTGLVIVAGVWSTTRITVDAIPDLSDVQVVIRTEYAGQAPQIVEDQVTYPLTTAMLAVPYAKTVRGYSMFGTSFVYVIFEDGTDMYWARSRVLEQLSFVGGALPTNVSPQLGPDATGVGWVYEYAFVTGNYCPEHAKTGAWRDPTDDKWYADPDDAPDAAARARLVHHRVFGDDVKHCPLDGRPLVRPDVDLSDLRGLQDWYLRYELTAVEGVSEVAPVGGFVKQYQVVVDPVKLLAYDIPLQRVKMQVQRSNSDVGGRLVEMSETEYMVRGLGYVGTLSDAEIAEARAAGRLIENVRSDKALDQLRKVALGATSEGRPIYLGDVADVRVGPEIRRGIVDWNGEGETVGGIVVMRYGENARTTIQRVTAKLAQLETGLPPGVALRTAYDRSDLINRSVDTLTSELIEEIAIVGLTIIIFLFHARSALVALFVLPTGVLVSVLVMHLMGINANIMSLGGIAIAIGVMVDSSIVMVENAHKHLLHERARVASGDPPRPRADIIADAASEVGPSLFFALLIITVSFLPVFALGEQSGRMFKPLAWTKTFSMASAAVLAVTIIPVLMVYFVNERLLPRAWPRWLRWSVYVALIGGPAVALMSGAPLGGLEAYRTWLTIGWVVFAAFVLLPQGITAEEKLPLSRLLFWVFRPALIIVVRLWPITLIVSTIMVCSILLPWNRLGSEFMPPLEEGDLLYMPTTDPGVSMSKARELLQQTDRLLMQFPEVQSVMGKAGRSETATDPAPPSMFETTVTLRRDKTLWRQIPVDRFFSGWPDGLRERLARIWPETRPITVDELVYGYNLPTNTDKPLHVPGLNEIVKAPGLTNAWTMPIKTRIDMLSTGIKTPVGVKVMGPDLKTLAGLSNEIATVIKSDERISDYTTSAFPEKSVGGNYLDIQINRDEIARYGLAVGDVQDVIMTALGGMNVSYTVEGLERYPINLRYPHELRDNLPALRQTLVATPTGAQVPLGQLAAFDIHKGPPMLKSENARLTSWVFVDIAGIDVGTYVANAQRAVAEKVKLPPGYSIVWSGQFEYMEAARKRLTIVLPVTLVIIVLLLYLATFSWLRVVLVLLTIPLSLVGAIWLLYLLDYNMSVAVWVGLIALAGLEVETGLVKLLYLDLAYTNAVKAGRMRNAADLWDAVYEGAVQRVRPITMTEATTFIALVPLLFGTGAGADTMRRLAAPMVGGVATGYFAILLVLPTLFYVARRIGMWWNARRTAPTDV
ncbi:MAG: AcrB/AcrD/AcrF family protein [Phycisphaera sp.]|nr:AcrB/AcrD/AcrF family protein [Phycisphaera sp.]